MTSRQKKIFGMGVFVGVPLFLILYFSVPISALLLLIPFYVFYREILKKIYMMPLHKAAEAGHIEAVKKHLAADKDVNAKLKYGGATPLHLAARRHKEIAELLIANGADVNAQSHRVGTPLHVAGFKGRKEIAELLIAKDADVNAKVVSGVKQGKTPLDAANETNYPETADLLRKHGGKTSEELKAEWK